MTSTAQQLFERGKIEGKIEGETPFLGRLRQTKFGSLAPDHRHRIAAVTPETRRAWDGRAMAASTPAEAFAATR